MGVRIYECQGNGELEPVEPLPAPADEAEGASLPPGASGGDAVVLEVEGGEEQSDEDLPLVALGLDPIEPHLQEVALANLPAKVIEAESDKEDYWEFHPVSLVWVRRHVVRRRALYVPPDGDDKSGPARVSIEKVRWTVVRPFARESESYAYKDVC